MTLRELEHADLFAPPPDTTAIVIPVVGEYAAKPPATYSTPMDTGYAYLARCRWRALPTVLGILHWRLGVRPHPLTQDNNGRPALVGRKHGGMPPSYHIISLPVRLARGIPIQDDFLGPQLRRLDQLLDSISYLKGDGPVLIPQFAERDRPWATHWRARMEYLASCERLVFISGKPGATL